MQALGMEVDTEDAVEVDIPEEDGDMAAAAATAMDLDARGAVEVLMRLLMLNLKMMLRTDHSMCSGLLKFYTCMDPLLK